MSTDFASFTNRGEYFSAHYFAEQLGSDLKKGLFATWTSREGDENDPRRTPRELLRTLRAPYLTEKLRSYFAETTQADAEGEARLATHNNPEWIKRLAEWHQMVLRALGYETTSAELTVHRAGRDHTLTVAYHGHGIIALDCGWAAVNDSALNADGAGRLLSPLRVSASESYETGAALASWLFQSELGEVGGPHPRFILLLCGGVILLADRHAWSEGRYLAANLDAALERNDRTHQGELATIAALFSLDMLRPGENNQSRAIDALLKSSSDNAVGVSSELRYGLQRSVEIIANEVLRRMAEPANNVTPADIESPKIPFARELTREALRYLYRILFLLYAEARPELGILPADDGSYEAGYSMARLRELVERDEELVEEEAKNGFHLYASLDVLFNKVNFGHREYGTEPDDDQPSDDEETRKAKAARRSEDRGLRFEPLRSELFEPTAIRLIGTGVLDPRSDEDDEPRWHDLRLRNEALHEVLRLLTMKKGRRGERGGFISYRNLGINQLGAVYEGLMSYTGIIADEELCEVAKGGDPEQGSWLIPSRKQNQYPDNTLVHYDEADARKGLRGPKKYDRGSFVYRLAGRDRETSASYYTPESLTKVTVELTLKNRLDQERDENGKVIKTRASELLKYKICEPALGSGAFLNEAINQVADEYLRRRQEELDITIPTADAITEKQKAKAYIALHNAYGVDLNATGVELAEVSLWLNTMHPGMRAPWFGLHLRRGNSLIGARRAVYSGDDVTGIEKAWLKAKGALAPTPLPFLKDGEPQPLPDDAVHQFLLPNPGWAAVVGSEEAKELAKEGVEQLAAWKKGILQRPQRSTAHLNKDGSPKLDPRTKQPKREAPSQFTRLRDAARKVEFLWSAVVKRMQLSEREIARRIDVWQADPADPEYAFLQRPDQAVPKEKVLEDLFNAVDTPYWRLKTVMDAWCALWFWPVDKAGLLDGTDGEYEAHSLVSDAEELHEALGGMPLTGKEPEPQDAPEPLVSPAPKPAPRFVEAVALFAVGPEQATIWELESTADDDVVVEFKKVGRKEPKKAAKPKTPQKRRIVPLKDLDDWLEFLEAMLGTAEVPEGTLLDASKSLDELKELEETIPHFMGMDFGNPEDRFPWLRMVRDIAKEQGFLHWELEFALVFASGGGFDLQVGNPPWVRPEWSENDVLAEHDARFGLGVLSESDRQTQRSLLLADPTIIRFVVNEIMQVSATRSFLGSKTTYPLLEGLRPDLYRGFMCRVWEHAASDGIAGLVHPVSHFEGVKEGRLRAAAYHRLRIHGHFVNGGNWAFAAPVSRTKEFGAHIYGPTVKDINFLHLSHLYTAQVLTESLMHDGKGEAPGIKFRGDWDVRPHRKRIVRVTPAVLAQWRALGGSVGTPVEETPIRYPVSSAENAALGALSEVKVRLAERSIQISSGFNETWAVTRDGLIEERTTDPGQWAEVILKGPQFGVATPLAKQPPNMKNSDRPWDLVDLPDDAVPPTIYTRLADKRKFRATQDRWLDHELLAELHALTREELAQRYAYDEKVIAVATGRAANGAAVTLPDEDKYREMLVGLAVRPYSDFYRLTWRRRLADNGERMLFASLMPPGPTHIDGVHSAILRSVNETALVAGFWASLPIDYFLRVTGRSDLRVSEADSMPAALPSHPLASPLLLRILRLNCITHAYAPLWGKLYNEIWPSSEGWAHEWPDLPRLGAVTREWSRETPLRTEYARRAALVEIDALVAVWLGVDAEGLVAAYRSRYGVMADYEADMWFDAAGNRITRRFEVFGNRQAVSGRKKTFEELRAHLDDAAGNTPPPEGFVAPFFKVDREAEMREAHAVFQKRLDEAIARGEWDPVKQEVPKP
ncbi:class I SAM-dependent DNA methyltransferase [Microbispora sp. NBC_01189]|uniref:class I SAM-dependent DNA methyltransferase n=1 Tax=Microbispora sp. NBC_01189 TaxID=2903583 RepID=UPI002E150D77|nr:class I SAM-dependent DNA methyltransferase [Microbispora sp. NBC_01189]